MACCDEIVGLVVKSKGALVGKELVLGLHSTESEDAGELKLAHLVTILLAQFLSLELDSHGCHVLNGLTDHGLDFRHFLLREHCHKCSGLDHALENGQTAAEVTLRSEINAFSKLLVEGAH